MQNLFINENDEFQIKFTVAVNAEGTIFCDIGKDSLIESFGEEVKDLEIKDYLAVFKRPSFGDSVGLYDSIFSVSDDTNLNFNPILARYNKISLLIKSWDLQGEPSKPTEEDIKKLHPTIATVIGIQLDSEVGGIFG